ncbi:MAG: hypothetical protein ACUVRD_04315 [Bacteroidia bacterium]
MRETLHSKLSAFRRRYYLQKMIRGLLLLTIFSGGSFVFFSLAEGVFWFGVSVRLWIFLMWLVLTMGIIGYMIAWPIAQYAFRLQGFMDDKKAAQWIGKALPEVKDKLLNTLQLSELSHADRAWIEVALEQKIRSLSVFPFTRALPWKTLKRAAYLSALVLFIGLVAWYLVPHIFAGGAYRVLRPTQPFSKPAPYTVELIGFRADVPKNTPIEFQIHLKGNELPAQLWLHLHQTEGTIPILLQRTHPHTYLASLPGQNADFSFYLYDGTYRSSLYQVRVYTPTKILAQTAIITYPPYTRKKPDTLSQPIITALKGSTIQWLIQTESTTEVLLSSSKPITPLGPNQWTYTAPATLSESYTWIAKGPYGIDSIQATLEVFADAFPAVQLYGDIFDTQTKSQTLKLRLTDDFGFSKVLLWYRILPPVGGESLPFEAISLPVPPQTFAEITKEIRWELLGYDNPEKRIEYYAEVWDNDLISGPKSARSALYTLDPPSETQKMELAEKLQDSLKKELAALTDSLRQLQAMLQKPLSTEDITKLKELYTAIVEKQKEIQKELSILNYQATELQLYTPELLEKLRNLVEELRQIPTQNLLQKLESLPVQKDSSSYEKLLQELEKAHQTWQEQLMRQQNLMEQIAQQQKWEKFLTELTELAERQRQLAQLPDSLSHPNKETEVQKALLEELKDKMRQVDSLRQNLSSGAEEALQELNQAQKAMEEALQKLQSGQSTQARPKQDKAAESIDKAVDALDAAQQAAQAEEEAEDYEALRMLLKNILSLSFQQEEIRQQTERRSPHLALSPHIRKTQQNLQTDYQQVRDSLQALANRSFVVQNPVLNALAEIDLAFENLNFAQPGTLPTRQHNILQGLNRLANLLTELLSEEKNNNPQNAAGGMPFKIRKKSSCSSGSSGASPTQSKGNNKNARQNPSLNSILQQQRKLNEELQRLTAPNPATEQTQPGLSPAEYGRLSAQQELLRLQLQKLLEKKGGLSSPEAQEALRLMEETEKDLLRQNFTHERLWRQNQILTRLLEFDKSQRERELDPERESRSAQQFQKITSGIIPKPKWIPVETDPLPARAVYRSFYQILIEKYLRKI